MTRLDLDDRSAAAEAPIAFGSVDVAVLNRLHAIARLLRAAEPLLPALGGIEIGLWADSLGWVYPYGSLDWDACQLLARTAGWIDLLAGADSRRGTRSDAIYHRASQAELPSCPPALTHFLTQLHGGYAPDDVVRRLAPLGWTLHFPHSRLIHPILPRQPTAHDAIEALLDIERAGELGDSPLGRLVTAAARAVAEGSP